MVSAREVSEAVVPFINSNCALASTWSLSFLSIDIQRQTHEDCSLSKSSMSTLIRCVDSLYCEAVQQTPTVFPSRLFNASWLLLDCFMLASKSPAMMDFEMDYSHNELKWQSQKSDSWEVLAESDAVVATH